MWKLCLASLLAASASALRGRGVIIPGWRSHKPGRPRLVKKDPACNGANATENARETQVATCRPFPGQQVVLVTVSVDFMPFFQNWLHYAGPFLTSSEQVVAFAEDEEVVPMLRRFLHKGARTPFKIAIPANDAQTAWKVTLASQDVDEIRIQSQDVDEIRIQDILPFDTKGFNELVSRRPRQIRHFLEQGCSVLYADIDTAWLKNPFREISRAGNFEMYVTDDSEYDQGVASDNLCSCFLYMHPTSTVKAVVSRWEFLLEGELHPNQARFTQAVQEIRKCLPDFVVALPREEFPPGLRKTFHPTVLHANWMEEKKKKQFLKRHRAWSLD